MMLPVWRTIVGTSCVMLLGAVVDRALGLQLGVSGARWPSWVLSGLVCLFVVAISPVSALLLLALLVLLMRFGARRPPPTEEKGPVWTYIVLIAAVTVCFVRPRVPLYWDEFVWLAKARIESTGWAELRRATLDPAADVIPAGYPILWSAAASWLCLRSTDAGPLLAGAAAATIVSLWLFLDGIVRHSRSTRLAARWPVVLAVGLFGLSPLVFVHLRSAYVDLPVGLLAATVTLSLVEVDRADRATKSVSPGLTALGALCAVALTGLKDEGFAHVGAICIAVGLATFSSRSRSFARILPVVFVLAAAAVPFAVWRVLLVLHRVIDADHGFGLPAFAQVPLLARTVLSHALDLQSWGLLWPAVGAVFVLVALCPRRFRSATRVAVLALCLQGLVLFGAIVVGPERVREFAFSGTLINRLLIQLAPASCVALLLACEDAAVSETQIGVQTDSR